MKADTLERDYLASQYAKEAAFHQQLMATQELAKRQELYVAAYRDAWEQSLSLSPEKETFGFQDPELTILAPWLRGKRAVDYGCGYGNSTRALARWCDEVIGCDILPSVVDIARQQTQDDPRQGRVRFEVVPPVELPLPENSADVIFLSDVIEHFHPEDARIFLTHARRVLVPGGLLVCITPHQNYGPSDISRHFVSRGERSEGFHIHEYVYGDLMTLLGETGFGEMATPVLSPRHLQYLPGVLKKAAFVSPAFRVWAEQSSHVMNCHGLRRLLGLNRSVYLLARAASE